ncbi:DinB family protein [Hymenobacter sp. RP-2-7]|uniref:DinB family protein n=1 Tax=Hymenobacter polaris TaxID=2682546 RepID=A0A7Y0AB78_9BACT|nr:DinB family protein [Hymenobacter polaris]NML64118.1 DinB family protein [Hymenobacter polaris]
MTVPQYLAALAANTQTTINLARQYSPAELSFRSADDCSIADLLEHICLVDGRTLHLLSSQSGPVAPIKEIYGDKNLHRILVDYKELPRLTELETAALTGLATTPAAFERCFLAQRQQLDSQLASGQLLITNQAHKHPYLGEMTVTDWLYYLLHHTTRHLHDIREVAQQLPPALN